MKLQEEHTKKTVYLIVKIYFPVEYLYACIHAYVDKGLRIGVGRGDLRLGFGPTPPLLRRGGKKYVSFREEAWQKQR